MESLLQRGNTAPAPALTTASLAFPRQPEQRYFRLQNWISDVLPAPRDLFLWLPEAYLQQPERQFPILLLHDGQNLFDGELSYIKGQTWQCGDTADDVFARGLAEPTVLVGIANTGSHRMAEYTPTPDTRLGGGKGPRYARLLTEELLPALRRDLRLLPGPSNTGLAGSSLGGLISLAIGLREPEVFGKLGVLSPSVWWDGRTILDDVRSLPGHLPLRIWLDMGTAEGQIHVRDTDLLCHLLQRKGWHLDARSTPPLPSGLRRAASVFERPRPPVSPDADLHYERVAGAFHNEAAWAARFGQVLQFLFPPRP
ncbi:alpha/beta hydrolase [Terriglobus aquaticus]|uniref:Alpha/beta hydrolase n=1 Tax=Terriglobus aquaticus TaxID=940139 RepID=A0ABW9KI26_9BACT|nr:alpha/beta hydrolase-fold protein [Terriglobus aquaticus]